jgi:hypothetical protein
MTMTTEPSRVDAGVPAGGQFAAKVKSDDVPSLGVPATAAPKIIASVTFQQWQNDYAIDVETIDFDAAPVLAAMSPQERDTLEDGEADDIYYSAVRLGLVKDHNGPFNVNIREALDYAVEEDPDIFEKLASAPVLRPESAILDTPLSAYEIGARANDDGIVRGLAVMGISELIENDVEQHNDAISDALTGSTMLTQPPATPVAVENGRIVMALEGDASALIADFDENELAQYKAGRAARAPEGA